MASAMMNPYIVKDALCHALWILTPVPDDSHIVVDRDLVTAHSVTDIEADCSAILEAYKNIIENPIK